MAKKIVKLKNELLIMIIVIRITTQELNKLTSKSLASRLAQANLVSKNDIASFIKKADFVNKLKNLSKKINSNKTKHLLTESEFKKLQIFDSILFIGQSLINGSLLTISTVLLHFEKTRWYCKSCIMEIYRFFDLKTYYSYYYS